MIKPTFSLNDVPGFDLEKPPTNEAIALERQAVA
jgi:hypothetical protein